MIAAVDPSATSQITASISGDSESDPISFCGSAPTPSSLAGVALRIPSRRRPGPPAPLLPLHDHRGSEAHRAEGASHGPHGRGRDDRREDRRHGGLDRRSRLRSCRTVGSLGFPNDQGTDRGLTSGLQRSRGTHAEGCSQYVAAIRFRRCLVEEPPALSLRVARAIEARGDRNCCSSSSGRT
jgi:hypothetical protein